GLTAGEGWTSARSLQLLGLRNPSGSWAARTGRESSLRLWPTAIAGPIVPGRRLMCCLICFGQADSGPVDWDNLGMVSRGERFVFNVRELSGALGDLGTLLPLTLGAISVAGLAPTPVLAGFGLFYVATAVVYRLPIPVQPMKVVAAVLLTTELTAAGLAA